MKKNTPLTNQQWALPTAIIFTLVLFNIMDLSAQPNKKHIEIKSKMWFVSELDHSNIMMDEEGNQFDHYDNFIVVYNNGEKIKIPYQSNYIFWDEYDENMNVTKNMKSMKNDRPLRKIKKKLSWKELIFMLFQPE